MVLADKGTISKSHNRARGMSARKSAPKIEKGKYFFKLHTSLITLHGCKNLTIVNEKNESEFLVGNIADKSLLKLQGTMQLL